VLARFVHRLSPRRDGPFVAVNCAAMPEAMLEALLFGHRKGAFTGAGEAGEGLFRAADKGTLLLDEIGELPLALHASRSPCGSPDRSRPRIRCTPAWSPSMAGWRASFPPISSTPGMPRLRRCAAISMICWLRQADWCKMFHVKHCPTAKTHPSIKESMIWVASSGSSKG
jgi:hypothetical protein